MQQIHLIDDIDSPGFGYQRNIFRIALVRLQQLEGTLNFIYYGRNHQLIKQNQ